MKGIKHDEKKIDYSLIPHGIMCEMAKVLTYGAEKYEPDNWKRLELPLKRYYAAAFRHLNSWFDGEEKDPESGLKHLSHAMTNIAFLIWFENHGHSLHEEFNPKTSLKKFFEENSK
jgi:hypothetical protein